MGGRGTADGAEALEGVTDNEGERGNDVLQREGSGILGQKVEKGGAAYEGADGGASSRRRVVDVVNDEEVLFTEITD